MFAQALEAQGFSLLAPHLRRSFPPGSERARWEALPPQRVQELEAWGREALAGYPALTATQFMAFVRTGDRQAFERPYFERRRRLMGAALAECARWDGTYLDAVTDGLWLICEESAWVISAHNLNPHPYQRPACEKPLPDVEHPYVDLFSAQTAATLAHVCNLLGDRLDAVTPLIRRRVYREIWKRVLDPFLSRDDFWWMGVVRRDLNNWTPWILSNVMDCLLLLPCDENVVREGLERAMRMLDRYLETLPCDGGLDEGCGYWNMAGGSLLDCLESLYTACGGTLDFYGDALVRALGEFPLKAHIAGDWFLNFADCDAKPVLDGERVYRYGQRTGNEALSALGAWIFASRPCLCPTDTPQMNRVLNALFFPPPAPAFEPAAKGARLERLQVFAFENNGLYAAIKGGHNGESHNHNDVGSFVLYLDGEPVVLDLGNMTYTAKTFGPQRYTLMNTRSRNHNVPLIHGVEQAAGREYAARDVRAATGEASMDIAGAYPAQAGLLRLSRRLRLEGTGLVLEDEATLREALSVSWTFMLRGRPRLERGQIGLGGLTLAFDAALTPEAEEIPVTDERMSRCFPGSVWRLTLTSAAAKRHRAEFRFQRSGSEWAMT